MRDIFPPDDLRSVKQAGSLGDQVAFAYHASSIQFGVHIFLTCLYDLFFPLFFSPGLGFANRGLRPPANPRCFNVRPCCQTHMHPFKNWFRRGLSPQPSRLLKSCNLQELLQDCYFFYWNIFELYDYFLHFLVFFARLNLSRITILVVILSATLNCHFTY